MEDVVKYHALKRGIRSKVDYTHVKLTFESFHLPPGVNALTISGSRETKGGILAKEAVIQHH